MSRALCFLISCFLLCAGCDRQSEKEKKTLFEFLQPDETGIAFENNVSSKEDFDVFRYRNFYNGGGVAIGDINNDGLSDALLTSNMGTNRLFLNKGGWKFDDITEKAGIEGTKVWSTGVSMADVNADGLLDIYICNSGDINGDNRENELFINNGDLTFTDKAPEMGLADKGFSTHAAFFDYDKDGDLDCFILNNSFRPIGTLGYRNLRDQRDELGGDKLMRNDNGIFKDVSELAGIYGSVIGFGLGVTVGDVNGDNWLDMYISNDFYERDYLYINNQDGTFSEKLEEVMGHISMFSMGADIADVNNDGYPDIFSTDMLPEDDYRLKRLTAFETYDVYQLRLQTGYYHQFMRNMLQLNRGDGSFVEIGQMAGVDATDWSWGALMVDFDNDAQKELFVCNGIFRDVTDQDYIEYMGSSETIREAFVGKKIDFKKFVDGMTSTPLRNYLFRKDTSWHYKNDSQDWGLDQLGFSNGAAYGDLDNDGDLDLIVNRVNMPVAVYRNDASVHLKNNSIAFLFKGPPGNVFGLGAKVKLYLNGMVLYYENMPMRGFQSSVDYKMIVGTGPAATVDSMLVTWPDGRSQVFGKTNANQSMVLDHANAQALKSVAMPGATPLLSELRDPGYTHRENEYNEFNRERLIFHMLSAQGPAMAVGDVNRDGLDDAYVGGAKGQAGALLIQQPDGSFRSALQKLFDTDSISEDVDALFFDADRDGDDDLYVVTGGTEYANQAAELKDRLYINETKGASISFLQSKGLPDAYHAGSCVASADIDHDGDVDLFVGTRVIPGYYGTLPPQYVLINDGRGNFSDQTATWQPSFSNFGMVTDGAWADVDQDGWDDLVVVGEWLPVTVFKNDGKKLTRMDCPGLVNSEGWWNTIEPADLDKDGKVDFILGNLGWNSRFRPTATAPVSLFVSDFDGNGSIDPVYTYKRDGKDFPFILRQDLLKQIPSLKKKFLYYKDYAGKSIEEVFPSDQLGKASVLSFKNPSSAVALNKGGFTFSMRNLPPEAQVSPVYAVEALDVNADGKTDLILGGNLFEVKPEVGRYDGLLGLVLLGEGTGGFTSLSAATSGLRIEGEVKRIRSIRSKQGGKVLIARNNNSLKLYGLRKQP